jgi:hypothetical protein
VPKNYGDDVYNVIARNRGAVQQIFYGRSKKIDPTDIARSIDLYLDRKSALPPTDERQLELALPQPGEFSRPSPQHEECRSRQSARRRLHGSR